MVVVDPLGGFNDSFLHFVTLPVVGSTFNFPRLASRLRLLSLGSNVDLSGPSASSIDMFIVIVTSRVESR